MLRAPPEIGIVSNLLLMTNWWLISKVIMQDTFSDVCACTKSTLGNRLIITEIWRSRKNLLFKYSWGQKG